MCGLFFLRNYSPERIGKKALKRYQRQKDRGQDGFGYVSVCDQNNILLDRKRFQDEDRAIKAVKGLKCGSLLFHHRFPTSTANVKECSHPIKVSHESLAFDFYLAHNGIISNDADLKIKHEGLGFKYETEIKEQTYLNTANGMQYTIGSPTVKWNDSEALAIDVALFLNGDQIDLGARGSIAFIGLMVDKQTQAIKSLVWGRNNSSPLILEQEEDSKRLTLASVGNGEEVKPDTMFIMDWQTGEITQKDIKGITVADRRPLGFDTARGGSGWLAGYNSKNSFTDDDDLDPSIDEVAEEIIYKIEELEEELETYNDCKMFTEATACQKKIDKLNKELDDLYALEASTSF